MVIGLTFPDPLLEEGFLLQQFNVYGEWAFFIPGFIVPGYRLFGELSNDSLDTTALQQQVLRLAVTACFSFAFIFLARHWYVRARCILGAFSRVVCAVGQGYSLPLECQIAFRTFWHGACWIFWQYRLLVPHMVDVIAKPPARWYWMGGIASWLAANLTDHCVGWPTAEAGNTCGLEASVGLLQAALKPFLWKLLSISSLTYALHIFLPGIVLTYREHQARNLFLARHAAQQNPGASPTSNAKQDSPSPSSHSFGSSLEDASETATPACSCCSQTAGSSSSANPSPPAAATAAGAAALNTTTSTKSTCNTCSCPRSAIPPAHPPLSQQQQHQRQQPRPSRATATAAAVARGDLPPPPPPPAAAAAVVVVAGNAAQPTAVASNVQHSTFFYKSICNQALVSAKVRGPPGEEYDLGGYCLHCLLNKIMPNVHCLVFFLASNY